MKELMAPTELDTHAAVNFLLEKVDPSGWHNIVAIPPDSKPIGRTFAPGQAAAMFDFVDTHNGTANLYYSVNEPRPNAPHDKLSAADIAAARAVHVDLDPPAGADLAADRIEYIRRVSSAPLPPTFLVDSGGGIQAFWKLAEKVPLTDPSWLRDLNEAACTAFDGDPSVKNVDRIMRLPHTLNIPTPTKLKKHPERRARMAELVDASGPTHAPDKLKAAFPARAADRVKKSEQPLVELDLPANIERAKHYLVNLAPEAIEGAGGNETTFRVAARCRDYALSEAQALDVMLDHWNEQKASPPWQPEDLASVVGNAFTYATGGWGSALAAAEFEVLDIDVGIRKKKVPRPVEMQADSGTDVDSQSVEDRGQTPQHGVRHLKLIRGSSLAKKVAPDREWFVPDLVPSRNVTMLYGDGATGKSLLALQLAIASAAQLSWLHQPVAPGKVLFISAEDELDGKRQADPIW